MEKLECVISHKLNLEHTVWIQNAHSAKLSLSHKWSKHLELR